jgi:hypothetical protein
LRSFGFLFRKYGFTKRVLEKVRAKCRRMGIIDHVSRFNSKYGYREGWVFSNRFGRAMVRLGEVFDHNRKLGEGVRREREFDALTYL